MLLNDIVEMTMRTGTSISGLDNYNLSNLRELPTNFVGKMQHGYGVSVITHNNSLIYVAKNTNDEILTMAQLTQLNIPKIGIVYEVSNSKTDSKFSGNAINYKLKYFLVHHLGYKLLAGKAHSSSTEKMLQRMPQYFDMHLVNVQTGELVDWSYENYVKLTSVGKVTDWQVLLSSTHTPFVESMPDLPGFDNTRHHWTYAEHLFEDCI